MPEIIKPDLVKKNFDFVDTIRCISMIGIVFEHAVIFDHFNYANFYTSLLQASVLQFFKFATITFFLIAGFLINHKFTEYSPLQYINNRLKKTIGPWLVWLHILIGLDIANLLVIYFKYKRERPLPDMLSYLRTEYYDIVFTTSFWFILNFLICIAILLLFKKVLYKIWFGAILLIISLFYSVNLHYGWIITMHSTALFGFIFYLWLGAFMNRHYERLSGFIRKTHIVWFLAAVVISFFVADLEIIQLKNNWVDDAYNTLRVSNILYSLLFFLMLLKIGSVKWINETLEPRNTTFGIYLIHTLIILHLLKQVFNPFHIQVASLTLFQAIAYSMARFFIAYLISLLLARIIMKTRLKWIVGA